MHKKTEVKVARIIDGKGKFFGLINMIDLFVILMLISFIPVLFIGYKILTKKEINKNADWVAVQMRLTETDPDFRAIITKGDSERDSFGDTIGRLIGISSVKASKVWVVVENKMISTIDHPVKRDIVIDADILCVKRDGVWYHKSQPVKIGSPILFETDMYNLLGTVATLKAEDDKGVKKLHE